MKEYSNKIIITGFISAGLLIIFFILQTLKSDILDLDVKWIIVSAIPLIIGLILSGIIKSFKGFGVELEINLSEKVELELIGKVECFPTTELTKQSIEYLLAMRDEEKNKIERLQLVSGKRGYYDSYAISEYMRHLGNLKFIEIIDKNGKFLALLGAGLFRFRHRFENTVIDYDGDDQEIRKLIQSIERENYTNTFKRDIITESIQMNDSLVIAYKKFQNTKFTVGLFRDQLLPVLDINDKMVGITSRIKLTEKIAQQVAKSEK